MLVSRTHTPGCFWGCSSLLEPLVSSCSPYPTAFGQNQCPMLQFSMEPFHSLYPITTIGWSQTHYVAENKLEPQTPCPHQCWRDYR